MVNGQTAPQVTRLRELAQTDQSAVLSVCHSKTEAAVADAPLWRECQSLVCRCEEILTRMSERLRSASAQIPRSVGFFVGASERQTAVQVAVRFLCAAEEDAATLRTLPIAITRIRTELHRLTRLRTDAELYLRLSEQAATGISEEICGACPPLLKEVEQARERAERLHRFLDLTERDLTELCSRILPNLNERIAKTADLEHEGKSCSPQALREVLGEGQHICERTCAAFHERKNDEMMKEAGGRS